MNRTVRLTEREVRNIVRQGVITGLNEISINAKKRLERDAVNTYKKGKSGGLHGIRTFGIITAENPNSQAAPVKDDKKNNQALLKTLKDGHYPVVKQLGHFFGNDEHSFFIINISLESLMYLAGKYEQTSFFFCTFVEEDGEQKVRSSYYEKQDTSKTYDKRNNPYIFIESSTDWVDASDEENYSKLGKDFKYTIPLKYFESIDRRIAENLKTFRPNSDCDPLRESIECVGQRPWYIRKKLYHGLL